MFAQGASSCPPHCRFSRYLEFASKTGARPTEKGAGRAEQRESVGRASVAIRKPLEWYDRNADNPPWIKALAEVRRLAPIAQMFRPQRGSSSQLAKQSEQIFRNGERKSSPVTCFARPSPAVNERRVADSQRSFRTHFQRTLFKTSARAR